MRRHVISIVRQLIHKDVIAETADRQPAYVEVHRRITSLPVGMKAATKLR